MYRRLLVCTLARCRFAHVTRSTTVVWVPPAGRCHTPSSSRWKPLSARAVCAHGYCSPEAMATIPDSRLCDRMICASATDQVLCRERGFVSTGSCRNSEFRTR